MNDRCDSYYESRQNPAYRSALARVFLVVLLSQFNVDLLHHDLLMEAGFLTPMPKSNNF